MNILQGNVYWSIVRFENNQHEIPHPYVVIQDNIINKSRVETVVVCKITTNMKKASWPGNIQLKLNEANLEKYSIVEVSQISSIKKTDLGEYIGQLSQDRIQQIYSGLKLIQSL